MSNIAVTIVCLTYNHEKYIRDALQGVCGQKTDFPYEVIVHDDASTDGTAAIIREFEANYPGIIKPIYQTENQHSKHTGIYRTIICPLVRGKYVAFCEGDDYWTDDTKLQQQYDFMESHPEYSMCTCASRWIDMKTGKTFLNLFSETNADITMEDVILEKKGRPFQFASFFLRTEVWNQWPMWRRSYSVGDTPIAMLAALNGKIRFIAKEMCVYRWRGEGSWTIKIEDKNHRIKEFEKMIGSIERFNHETDGKYDDLVRQRICSLRYKIALANRDFHSIRSGDLRELYNTRSFVQKCADFSRCKVPALYLFLKKMH